MPALDARGPVVVIQYRLDGRMPTLPAIVSDETAKAYGRACAEAMREACARRFARRAQIYRDSGDREMASYWDGEAEAIRALEVEQS